jgi:hypothetical protein
MSNLSFKLAKALIGGRAPGAHSGSRETILARLLHKRAAAQRAGLKDQEALLRQQILWALPVRSDDALEAASAAPHEEAGERSE